jgi:hypothetical protein
VADRTAKGVVVETRMNKERPQVRIRFLDPFTDLISPWLDQNPTGPGLSSALLDFGSIAEFHQLGPQIPSGHGIVTRVVDTVVGPGGTNGSGTSQNKRIWDAMQMARKDVKRVLGVEETTNENDVKIWEVKEEVEHILADFAGFFSKLNHPLFNTIKIPQLKNLPTALAPFSSILSSGMLDNIPGDIFSLGNLRDLLTDDMKKEITDALPKELQTVLNTVLKNMVSVGGNVNGKRVNLPIFLANVVTELKNAKSAADIISILEKLRDDDSFSGMDLLDDYIEEIEGAMGNTSITIDSSGNVSASLLDSAQELFDSLQSTLNSLPSVTGNLWENVPDLGDQLSRLTDEALQRITDMKNEIGSAPNG